MASGAISIRHEPRSKSFRIEARSKRLSASLRSPQTPRNPDLVSAGTRALDANCLARVPSSYLPACGNADLCIIPILGISGLNTLWQPSQASTSRLPTDSIAATFLS